MYIKNYNVPLVKKKRVNIIRMSATPVDDQIKDGTNQKQKTVKMAYRSVSKVANDNESSDGRAKVENMHGCDL